MGSMKIDKFLTKEELPDFFRELADALESGGDSELSCATDFKKFKVRVRDEYGQISLRLKIKSASECTPDLEELEGPDEGLPAVVGKPQYKDLKKRMGNSFKVIFKMIHQGQKPPQEAIDEFLADSELMVSYPGYGDPYYDIYTKACEEFKAAYEADNMDRLNKAVDELVHQKGHCHAKYK